MKYYLSSFKIGNEIEKLKSLLPTNKKTAYISNALDMVSDQEWLEKFTTEDVTQLTEVGLDVSRFNLREYFGNRDKLSQDIKQYGVIWVSGGNVFVLRQAMKLSGFDEILKSLTSNNEDMLYGGYSAGICVLAPSLKGLELVDSLENKPYGDEIEIIWEGLEILPYVIVPHFDSDHPESEAINSVVKYNDDHGIEYRTLRDGEVIVIDK